MFPPTNLKISQFFLKRKNPGKTTRSIYRPGAISEYLITPENESRGLPVLLEGYFMAIAKIHNQSKRPKRRIGGRRPVEHSTDPYTRLSLKVLEIAVKDARHEDPLAVWWLKSIHAEPFIFIAGFTPEGIRRGLKHAGLD